jgi:two-component system, cell cycle response regulator CpdR
LACVLILEGANFAFCHLAVGWQRTLQRGGCGPLVLHIAVDMLKDLGCEVIAANNGPQALQKLAADSRVEVLITDINMPGMDGYELVDAALNLRGSLKVIMLSGRLGDGHGFPVIRKPFLQRDLIKTMAAHTGLC